MFWLRFNLDVPEPYLADMARTLAWVVPLQAAIFLALGLYRGLWRFASTVDLQRIVLAAGLGALLIPLVLVMLQLQAVVPRSVLIFYPMVLIFLMAGNRFAYRIWKEHRLYSPFAALGEPVLVVGAGEAGARLSKEFARSRQWRVVGLLDDDPRSTAGCCATSTCWGRSRTCPRWATKFGVRKVIIALPSAAHGVRRRVAEICAANGLEALTVPSYEELISGRSRSRTIRTVELDDLLGRDPVDARQRRGSPSGSATAWCWSPAPAARSAPSCAGRSRASGRRGSCCSTLSEAALYEIQTGARRRVPAAAAVAASSATSSTRRCRGGARARAAERRLPRRRVQARAADGGDQRLAGGAQQRLGTWRAGARGDRGARSRSSC